MLRKLIPLGLKAAAAELASYLKGSFGDRQRMDYGTGHETTFVCLLFALTKLAVLTEEDCQALVAKVFKAYVDLVRDIQQTYR